MVAQVSIYGKTATSAPARETIVLSSLDPKVERTMTKDLMYNPMPTDESNAGGYGYDMLFSEDMLTITATLKDNSVNHGTPPVAPATTTKNARKIYTDLWYMMKQDETVKTVTWGTETFKTLCKRISVHQIPGEGNLIKLNMQLLIVTELE